MRKALTLLAVLGLTAGFFAADAVADKEAGLNATCPVSGKPAVKEQSARFKGKTVNFCCPNCKKAYTEDRKKFTNAVYAQLLETKQITQVACWARRPSPSAAISARARRKRRTMSPVWSSPASTRASRCRRPARSAARRSPLTTRSRTRARTSTSAARTARRRLKQTRRNSSPSCRSSHSRRRRQQSKLAL
jgi:YHS domain-containing protein